MWLFFLIREDLWSREKLADWALQERTLLVSLFKCLKWIFRSTFPYTLDPPTLSQNYASRGIFRYHLPLTLWWNQGPLKVRCIRAVPLCSMSISKGPSMIWVWLAPQSCIRYFILECFLERVSCSLPLFSGVWYGIIFPIDVHCWSEKVHSNMLTVRPIPLQRALEGAVNLAVVITAFWKQITASRVMQRYDPPHGAHGWRNNLLQVNSWRGMK